MEFLEFDQFELAGLAGVTLYLAAYAALQFGILRGAGYVFSTLNIVAAVLILISLAQSFNLPYAIMLFTWMIISTCGILRLLYLRNTMCFSKRDRLLVEGVFSGMPVDHARALLNAGHWRNLRSGSVLMHEETPASHLHIMVSGDASIFKNGKRIAFVAEGDFIGAMTCFDGSSATQTAVTAKNCEVFSIEVAKLGEMAPAGSAFRHSLETAISNNLQSKLERKSSTGRDGPGLHRDVDDTQATTNLLRDLDLVTTA